mmetsp:Transcript_25200/g.47622  ORF Transcript_25200/g.47622 Transcript_25200/m.47622 type:complete len:219 (+) Transcript_25200:151-807(+)|eukprot:CAMPEP_0114302510 /NCGR_PEP_ID=MMETSP0059-20121206/14698_1 /TAXON_ID=36894 /ORGANISM="Pyramimonas parkeae, Strain CCMP726" /LENGTH=218 /DNA_ID=CAMNT_0001425359 /DNA_START=140 /DNA_END=796 /DNA_ORIENTATION=-
MPIHYTLTARGSTVLAEYSCSPESNAGTIARRILEKLASVDIRVSYSLEGQLFHVLVSDGITYLCMADDAFGRRVPFAFLEEVRRRFTTTYAGGATTALAYAYNTEFSRVLHQQMEYFSNNPNADGIERVKDQIEEVKRGVVDNVDKMLQRGEKIDVLVDKADNLNTDAFRFKRQTTHLKNTLWWRNVQHMVALAIAPLLLLWVFILMICGLDLQCGN